MTTLGKSPVFFLRYPAVPAYNAWEMKNYVLYAAVALFGVLCLAHSVSLYAESDGLTWTIVQFGGLGLLFLLGAGFFVYDDRSRAPKMISEKRMLKGNEEKLSLTFDELRNRFRLLAARDELIVADKRYLSWNSGSFAQIRIEPLSNGDWICIYWVNADHVLTDATVKKLCAAHGIQAPKSLLVKPQGLAICKAGVLHHYPAFLKGPFRDAFADTVLNDDAAFEAWVKECDDEEV